MKITKQFLVLLILVLVIVPLFNIGGCGQHNWANQYKVTKQIYKAKYGDWTWEKRYKTMRIMELQAMLGGEEFNWLDLPVEKIQVTDTPGETGGHHH